MNRTFVTWAAGASMLVACGGSNSTDEGGGGTPPPDTVLMTPGSAPTYGWNYGNADTVDVSRSSDIFTPVWRTVSTTLDGIPSGLMHGTTGADRTVPVNTETTLASGVSYRVRIVRQTGSSVVTKTFTVP